MLPASTQSPRRELLSLFVASRPTVQLEPPKRPNNERRHAFMTDHLLDCRQVGTGVK